MRLTIWLLGRELITVSTDTDAPDDDCARDLSGGTLGAMPMGFTAHMDRPHEVETPDRDW